ncbi:MAG TPA: hypothetical protein DCE42_19105 [Myxococcales bacterium]|nr:hypothetical protein [Deltaproteobacteria bacterium]HAA56883.1 hypothetical protein [Myxococcales bacterium]|tara:strand:+ start:3958 stop:4398 length:441 start_codon:yes stop_codon:yes gene_type:complete
MTLPEHLQKHELVTIDPLMSVHDAAMLMLSEGIGALIIMEENKLVGMLTERDLMNKVVAKDKTASETFVQQIMTTDLHTANINTTLSEALHLMGEHKIRHLPYIDENGKPLCMFSFRDLYEYRLKQLEHENEALHTLAKLGISPSE